MNEYRNMPREEQINALGGEDGGRQRAALINSSVINDDVDLDDIWHARIITDFDDANYSITIRMEVTRKSLTELAQRGMMTVSDEALEHSSIGTFNQAGRITGGNHSEAGIEEPTKRGIEYNIIGTFSNGVRLGNIPSHKEKFKRTGKSQAWFPPDWDDDKIMEAGTAIANSDAPMLEGHYKIGEYMGVLVRVEFDSNGEINSVCPDYNQEKLEGVDWIE